MLIRDHLQVSQGDGLGEERDRAIAMVEHRAKACPRSITVHQEWLVKDG